MLEIIARNQPPICHCMMVGTQDDKVVDCICPAFTTRCDVVNRNNNVEFANHTLVTEGFQRHLSGRDHRLSVPVVRVLLACCIAVFLDVKPCAKARITCTSVTAIFSFVRVVSLCAVRLATFQANKLYTLALSPFGIFSERLRLVLVRACTRTIDMRSRIGRFSINEFPAHFAWNIVTLALVVLFGMFSFVLGIARAATELLWARFVGNKQLAAVLTGDFHNASLALSHRMLSEGGVSCRRIGLQSLSDTLNYTANGAIAL